MNNKTEYITSTSSGLQIRPENRPAMIRCTKYHEKSCDRKKKKPSVYQ